MLNMLSEGTDVAEIKQFFSITSNSLPKIGLNVNQNSLKSNWKITIKEGNNINVDIKISETKPLCILQLLKSTD